MGYNSFMPSYPHIEQYRAKLQELIEFGGSDNEENIRPAFQNCLDAYCRDHRERLVLIPELKTSPSNKPDGTVKDSLRMARGYWEAKDSHDDLDAEIQVKFNAMGRDPVIARDSPGRGISALPGRVGACLMGVSSGIAPVWGYDSGSAALVWMLCLEVCASRFTRKRRRLCDAAFGFPVLLPATLSWSCGPWRSPTGRCVCCRQAGPF